MKKLRYILILFLGITSMVSAQTVLLHVDEVADTTLPENGRNLAHFTHFYVGFGLLAGPTESGAPVVYENSGYFSFGHRYKRKISNTFSAGFDVQYTNRSFFMDGKKHKVVPDSISHDKEKLIFHEFGLGVYQRINYGKRGNVIGWFFDIGARLDWAFSLAHRTKDKLSDGSIRKVNTTKLGIENPFNYGVYLRAGFNKLSVMVQYRLSDQFKPSVNLPELPAVMAGIQLGFH